MSLPEEDVMPLHEIHMASNSTVDSTDRKTTYRDALFRYAAEIISSIATKRAEQWEIFCNLEPGLILFSFQNHTRIYFSRRGDRLIYKFRTQPLMRKLGPFSFRTLWVIQSPIFQEVMTIAMPLIDKGSVYLSYRESDGTFNVRVSWTDTPYLPEGEVLVQSLIEYDVNAASNNTDTGEVFVQPNIQTHAAAATLPESSDEL